MLLFLQPQQSFDLKCLVEAVNKLVYTNSTGDRKAACLHTPSVGDSKTSERNNMAVNQSVNPYQYAI